MVISTDIVPRTYGALLIGTLVATFLSGMNTLQTVVYFRVYTEDRMRLKALVATIWCLDIIHDAFIWHDLWFCLVTTFGQTSYIPVIEKPDIVPGAVTVGAALTLIVHMFYVYRIFRFSQKNYWITMSFFILILGDLACIIGTIVMQYWYQDLSTFIDRGYAWIVSLALIFAAISDIGIMVILFLLLQSSRQQTISMNNVIDRLIIYTFETGSLTAFMAIAIMITWLTEQGTDIYLSLYLPLSKVYAMLLLGLLNTRYYLRHDQDSQIEHPSRKISFANPVSRSGYTNPVTLSIQSLEASTQIQQGQHIRVNVSKSV